MPLKKLIIAILILSGAVTFAQQKIAYGIKGGLLINTATLPDISINTSIHSLLQGDDVAKGVAQYAEATINYQFGGFVSYTDGFGFSMLESNYTRSKIYKEIHYSKLSTTLLDLNFSYLDIALSYNIFLNQHKKTFFILGGGPAFLVSHTGKETPKQTDIRVFSGLGYHINENLFISARAELGVNEVYKGSYIHHILFPISVSVKF